MAPHHAEADERNVVGLIPSSVGTAAQPPISPSLFLLTAACVCKTQGAVRMAPN